MSREYKNKLQLSAEAYGTERRRNLAKEALKDGSPFPATLEYKDIDAEFKKWVEDELEIEYDGGKIPTILLFSNQRFSEYIQSWFNLDDKKNFKLNFKAITRENNPKGGTLYGSTRNIPGEHTYLMKRVEARDKNDRKYFIEYRIKQPFCVDMIYTITLVTNKYDLLNEFNQKVNDKFKAIDAYMRPNGHYIGMKLTDISDESDYSIDDRRFYSQSFRITVMAYIITPDSFVVEEKPYLMFQGFDGERSKTYAEIEDIEMPVCENTNYFEYKPLRLTVSFDVCDKRIKFRMDSNMRLTTVVMDNVRNFEIWLNDDKDSKIYVASGSDDMFETKQLDGLEIKDGSFINISKVSRYRSDKECRLIINGVDWTEVFDTRRENVIGDEVEINNNGI